MICFDTNIIIYLANRSLNEDIVGNESIAYASITTIESLGYSDIRSVEELRIKELLATLTEIPLTDAVIETAIRLRQQKKMSLGDAIVAATALVANAELWTVNEKDFVGIDGLRIHNPLKVQ